MIVHSSRSSTNSMQPSTVSTSETKTKQVQHNSQRMQHEEYLSQEFYVQSSHRHFQYQHENHSISSQPSSTSDVDETSSSLHKINQSVSNKMIKKKKQTKKKRKDPNEPQKPVSPYALFFRDTQNDIKKKLANPSFGEISKVVAHMWESIDPEVKEQYKHKAAAAKKEYLKQLAAYRAVQISHQTPDMHHILHQSSLPFHLHSIQHQAKSYPSGSMIVNHQPQFSSSSSSSSSSMQQYNHFPYMHSYPSDNSSIYHSDRSTVHVPNHSHSNYSSYELNKTYPDCQQYNLLRPGLESDPYVGYYPQPLMENEPSKSTEHLLHNFNQPIVHYTDLQSGQIDQHYHQHHHHHALNKPKEEQQSPLMPTHNENDFHWNPMTCSTTEW